MLTNVKHHSRLYTVTDIFFASSESLNIRFYFVQQCETSTSISVPIDLSAFSQRIKLSKDMNVCMLYSNMKCQKKLHPQQKLYVEKLYVQNSMRGKWSLFHTDVARNTEAAIGTARSPPIHCCEMPEHQLLEWNWSKTSPCLLSLDQNTDISCCIQNHMILAITNPNKWRSRGEWKYLSSGSEQCLLQHTDFVSSAAVPIFKIGCQ